jgi:hypothetical protein
MLQRRQRQSKENQMRGGKRPVLADPIGSHRATKPTAVASALDQLSLGATSSWRRRVPRCCRWDTRGKKPNDCVERSGIPLFTV